MNVLYVASIGSIVIMYACYIFFTKDVSIYGQRKMSMNLVYTVGLVLWPLIWKKLFASHLQNPLTYAALAWPLLYISFEIYLSKYQGIQKPKAMMSMDANALCTLAFALSGVLGAHKDASLHNIFVYGVLLAVAFVMPSPHAPNESLENVFVDAGQRVCLTYATGLVLGGSILMNEKKNQKGSTVPNESE